jgi:hypothetical protein
MKTIVKVAIGVVGFCLVLIALAFMGSDPICIVAVRKQRRINVMRILWRFIGFILRSNFYNSNTNLTEFALFRMFLQPYFS